jgi:hypothetical protein
MWKVREAAVLYFVAVWDTYPASGNDALRDYVIKLLLVTQGVCSQEVQLSAIWVIFISLEISRITAAITFCAARMQTARFDVTAVIVLVPYTATIPQCNTYER